MKIIGNATVLKAFEANSGKTYLDLVDFEQGSVVKMSINTHSAKGIKPGQAIQIDGGVFFGQSQEGGGIYMVLDDGAIKQPKAAN